MKRIFFLTIGMSILIIASMTAVYAAPHEEHYADVVNNIVQHIEVVYNQQKEDKEMVLMRAAEYVSQFNNAMSEREKVVAIHDYLINVGEYDFEINDLVTFSPVPLFVPEVNNGMAVCQGYAIAFKVLCNAAGIESTLQEGMINGVSHLWNKIRIDGEWYHVDVTSDELLSPTLPVYDYFGLSDQEMHRTHEFSIK